MVATVCAEYVQIGGLTIGFPPTDANEASECESRVTKQTQSKKLSHCA